MRNKTLTIFNKKIKITDSRKFIYSKLSEKNIFFLALNSNKLSINDNDFWKNITDCFEVLGYLDGIGAKIRFSLFNWKRIAGVDLWLEIFENLPSGSKVTIYGASTFKYCKSSIS